ncbi:unnamed protein product [Effrenium voratum]|nr:unnamed protein product [Effrenium voratum]
MQPGEAEEEKLGKDIGNVIILVHGIGEKMWSEEGCGLAASTGSFRRMVQVRQLETAGFVQKGGHWTYPGETPPKLKKDEVLEASWWESVHTDEMDTRLARITLPSMKQVRQIANFAVVDALYYLQVGRKEKIIAAVARSVETALQRFRAHHPQHEGAVVLAGHSLGGAILFELLRSGSAQLSFTPQALFTMGSPTGLFMHCADALPSPDFELPGTRFYNIFHPLDPVAYRIEPLIAEQLDKLDPAKVPVEGAWGGMKAHHGVQQLMNWASGEEKKQSELLEICRALKLNAGERVDWVLQEDLTFLNAAGVAGELLQALPSHSCYMKSADVAGFVQSRTANIMLAKGVLKRDPTTANLGTPVPSLAPAVASPAPESEAEPCPAKEPVAA